MLRLRKLMDEQSDEPVENDVSDSESEGTTYSQPVQAATVSQQKQLKQLEDMMMEQGKQIAELRDIIECHTIKVANKVDAFESELLNFDVKLRNGTEQVKPSEVPTLIVRRATPIKCKIPTFDGNTSYLVFRIQFEVAIRHFDEEKRKNALICSLYGPAAEVLQQISFSERNYENLMEALDLKYGDNHLSSLRQRKWQIKPNGLVEFGYSDAEPVTKDELLAKMFNYAMRDKKLQSELELGGTKKSTITKDPKIPPIKNNVLQEIEHFTEKVIEIMAEENKRNVLLREILEETSRASPLHLADKLNKLLDEEEQQNSSQRMPNIVEESEISTISDVIQKLQGMTERLLEIDDGEKKYHVDVQHEQPEEIVGDESWAPPGSTIV